MKIKLEQLVASNVALGNILNAEIPISTAFKLGKVIDEIQDNLKRFDESRNAVVKKYGKEQKDGSFLIPEKHVATADKELEELLNTEIEINTDTFSIGQLGDIKVKSVDMNALKWLLTE